MTVEVCSYRLTSHGKPAGSHVLKTFDNGRNTQLEAKLQLQGSLGQWTVLQQSRCHTQRFHSLQFTEENSRRGERRTYEVEFNLNDGMVHAKRNQKDSASVPYIRPFRDPLSLLFELRGRCGEELIRVPMLGKDVVAQRLGEVELDTGIGKRAALAYSLHPGGSYVYLDVNAPHHLLKLTQRLTDQWVDALLVKVAHEAPAEALEAKPTKGRRRSRRRRRRKAKS